MKIPNLFLAMALSASVAVAAEPQYYTKQVDFPPGATLEQKIDMASRLIPTQKQVDWQNLKLTAFLHFGPNTFTSREWGDGKEDPRIFNPQQLDTDQWVKALKDAGFNLVMLTAKHHDGFCLWPTKTTKHSVASSPWRDGKGDVVADLRRSCDKFGMKLGLYLSPWDRNAAVYGSEAYNDMFVEQLTELLTQYGKVDEVWFDGACGEGPNGKKQVYDWQRFRKTIETLQPDAVMAITGDDVRWVGNERGMGRETEWSATALTPAILPGSDESNKAIGIWGTAKDLGSREIVAKADHLYWWPSEVDVSIRPGWFYHKNEVPKSLRQLAEIYLRSVGRNSVLLLNIPPDTNGLIDQKDVTRLQELRAWLDANIEPDLVKKFNRKKMSATLKKGAVINGVTIGEDISKGQHVEEFYVEAKVDGRWQKVAEGTTVGFSRILTFPDVKATEIRVMPVRARGAVYLDKLRAHYIQLPEEVNVELPGYRPVPTADWKVVECSGSLEEAPKAWDGADSTHWTSAGLPGAQSITVDMGQTVPVAAFLYSPRAGEDKSGTVYHYTLEFSEDGQQWTKAPVSGEFSNIAYNPITQRVYFPSAIKARYVRFTGLDEIEGRNYITIGEMGVYTPE